MFDRPAEWHSQGTARSSSEERMHRAAAAALEGQIRAGAIAYRRERDLAGLIRGAEKLPGEDEKAHAGRILARLRNALRAERARARAGHWSYDLNRHIALKAALKAESEASSRPMPESKAPARAPAPEETDEAGA